MLLISACDISNIDSNDAGLGDKVNSGAPEIMVDAHGTTWKRSNEATFTTHEQMVANQRNELYDTVIKQHDIGQLTDSEFHKALNDIEFGSFPIDTTQIDNANEVISADQAAEKLRGISLYNGYEYVTELDHNMANLIARKLSDVNVTEPSETNEYNLTNKAKCCGNDNRFTTNVYNDYARILLSEVGCTAGIISENVAITAAHCLYDTVANSWYTVKHTSVDTGSPPWYWRHTSYNDTTPAGYACYKATVPDCWKSATSNGSFVCDYAVLDFSIAANGTACADTTPFDTWNGVSIKSDAGYESASTWAIGFPAYVNTSGGSINSGLTFMFTRLNGTWGYNTIINGTPYFAPSGGVMTNIAVETQFQNLIDAHDGDSGRPQLDYITSGNYQVALHVGVGSGYTENLDRRIDSTVWSFIQAYSPL